MAVHVCVFILCISRHEFICNPLQKLCVSEKLDGVMAIFLSVQQTHAAFLHRQADRLKFKFDQCSVLGVRRQTEK